MGLGPAEPQYGDKTALRKLGVKSSPETGSPVFFNPVGGRPKVDTQFPQGFNMAPPAQDAAVSGDVGQAVPPPLPETNAGIPADHHDLIDRALKLSRASVGWSLLAQQPGADPETIQMAQAVKGAASIAIQEARDGTPFYRGQ